VLLLAPLGTAAARLAPPPPRDYGPLPTISRPSTVSRIEGRLSAGAGWITARNVQVRCWSAADWRRLGVEWLAHGVTIGDAAAYADPNNGRVHLAPKTCASFVSFLYRKARPSTGTAAHKSLAYAVVTLGHESQHVAGVDSEARAECYGQQRVRPLAEVLGASKAYAAGLTEYAWRVLYRLLPPAYKHRSCRDGGPWDLNPRAVAWP
jgi:hypothetical protein